MGTHYSKVCLPAAEDRSLSGCAGLSRRIGRFVRRHSTKARSRVQPVSVPAGLVLQGAESASVPVSLVLQEAEGIRSAHDDSMVAISNDYNQQNQKYVCRSMSDIDVTSSQESLAAASEIETCCPKQPSVVDHGMTFRQLPTQGGRAVSQNQQLPTPSKSFFPYKPPANTRCSKIDKLEHNFSSATEALIQSLRQNSSMTLGSGETVHYYQFKNHTYFQQSAEKRGIITEESYRVQLVREVVEEHTTRAMELNLENFGSAGYSPLEQLVVSGVQLSISTPELQREQETEEMVEDGFRTASLGTASAQLNISTERGRYVEEEYRPIRSSPPARLTPINMEEETRKLDLELW